jgi:CHAT domain-containing protein
VLHDGKRFLIEDYRVVLFTEAAKDKLKDKPQATWRAAALGMTRKVENFAALPSVKGELEGIIRTGNRGVLPGEVHLDDAFTANRLRDVLDKAYPVLHLASHFKFQPGTEANSFLLLGDGKYLSLKDLKEGDYRFEDVDLITLSACETAVGGGKDANGMEIEGLGALAQKQGAKGVLATLWPVADESTGLLMQQFYRLRESGKLTKAEALRQAQLGFLNSTDRDANASKGQYRHPFYWAPFILMGNWL